MKSAKVAACSLQVLFRNEVGAQSGKRISGPDAASLIAGVEDIQRSLGCR